MSIRSIFRPVLRTAALGSLSLLLLAAAKPIFALQYCVSKTATAPVGSARLLYDHLCCCGGSIGRRRDQYRRRHL